MLVRKITPFGTISPVSIVQQLYVSSFIHLAHSLYSTGDGGGYGIALDSINDRFFLSNQNSGIISVARTNFSDVQTIVEFVTVIAGINTFVKC